MISLEIRTSPSLPPIPIRLIISSLIMILLLTIYIHLIHPTIHFPSSKSNGTRITVHRIPGPMHHLPTLRAHHLINRPIFMQLNHIGPSLLSPPAIKPSRIFLRRDPINIQKEIIFWCEATGVALSGIGVAEREDAPVAFEVETAVDLFPSGVLGGADF